MRVLKELCSSAKVIIANGGHRGEIARQIWDTFGYVLKLVINGCDRQGFKPIQKRWVVGRTFV